MNDLPGSPNRRNDPAGDGADARVPEAALDRVSDGALDRVHNRFDQVEHRLAALEQRIALLESANRAMAPAPPSPSAASASPLLPEIPHWQAGGIFPVLGRAMLGIAGAYLLRALSEAQVLPGVLLELVAIAYALLWLAAAARARTAFSAATYSCTSVLILAPMLWELTVRFKGMPPWVGALTLAAFVVEAFALARGPYSAPVLRIANVSAAVLSLALAVATHDNLPFLGVLLLACALCEFAPPEKRFARLLLALAADLGVWMLIYIYQAPQDARADYPALNAAWLIAPGFLLFAIFAASLFQSGVPKRQRISLFDAAQVTIAFLLAASGLLYFGPAIKQTILGLLCLALATALYAAVFAWLDHPEQRNRIVFGTWSAALVLAGIWLSLPAPARPACLAVAAITAVAAAARFGKSPLAVHGAAFLLASAWASGLLTYAFHALAGTPAAAPTVNICIAAICAAVCYGFVAGRPALRTGQPFPFLFASVAAIAAAALLAQGSTRLAATLFELGPHHIALLRTVILCGAALALAFSGARWQRRELTQIGYAVVALEAVKLVLEDLRHGHLAYIAASVCLFAFTLIAIPRAAHSRRHQTAA